MAEKLFWKLLAYLNEISPNFKIQGRQYCALPRRFKRMIHVVDSTTIHLIANCLDWAKHRRRKTAAKMHLRLDLRSFLPNFILVKTAGTHDAAEAKSVCSGVNDGEIVIFDKAYVDFKHLCQLLVRGVFWRTRAKDNWNPGELLRERNIFRFCKPLMINILSWFTRNCTPGARGFFTQAF